MKKHLIVLFSLLIIAFSSHSVFSQISYCYDWEAYVYGYSELLHNDQTLQVSGLAGTDIIVYDWTPSFCDHDFNAWVYSELANSSGVLNYGRLESNGWEIEGQHPTFNAQYRTYCVSSAHGLVDYWSYTNGKIIRFFTDEYTVGYTQDCHTFTPPPTPCNPLNGLPCQSPTPTPTPTPTPPTLSVTEVGFTGDYEVTRFASNQPIDSPDGSTPTWVRGGSNNDKNPVAYKKGATNVTVFGKFTVSPAPPSSINAVVKVSKGSRVLSQNVPVTISGSTLMVPSISLNSSELEPEVEVKRKKYQFKWEISFNNGQNWNQMGNSGDHEIHWLFDAPLQPAWINSDGQPFPGLFDEALNHSTGELGGGETDMAKIIRKISKEVANDVRYKPNLGPVPLNRSPLEIIAEGGDRRAVCWDNALLLRGLLRSIGVDGNISFYWGGNPTTGARHFYYRLPTGTEPMNADTKVTLQASRPYLGSPCTSQTDPRECVEKNSHFTYHTTVSALGRSYDPSYGEIEDEVKFIESVSEAGQIKTGNAANAYKVTRNAFAGGAAPYDSLRACRHRYDFYGTGGSSAFNFDSDGITDLAVTRGSTGEWIISNSYDGSTTTLYQPFQPGEDFIVPGDYDGDGKIDAAVWLSNGRWIITNSSDGSKRTEYLEPINTGDRPVPGDYDGDQKTDIAGWLASGGIWHVIRSSDGSRTSSQLGLSTDIPVPGDYDGDRKTDLAVWRPSEGNWYVFSSETSSWIVRSWGLSTDIPVPGDYDGDGINDFAVLRPSTGIWYSLDSSNDYAWRVQQGEIPNSGDMPIPGDYDGDSQTDAAIWLISDGTWRIISSRDNSFQVRWWGNSTLGDIPVPSAYVFR